MSDATLTRGRNVVDFAGYRTLRHARAQPIRPLCRHCGAALGDGESAEDCSSAGLNAQPLPRRKFRAE